MSKVQLHAYVLIVLLALTAVAAKIPGPLTVRGRVSTDFSRIPVDFGDWYGTEGRFDEKTYESLPSASLLVRYYEHADDPVVDLAIVYGTDLGDFHQPEVCLEGQGLESLTKRTVRIKNSEGGTFDAISVIMDSPLGKRAFVYWFYSKGNAYTSLGTYKIRMLGERITMRKTQPSAMIRLSTSIDYEDDREAVDRLVEFADAVVPYLNEEFAAESEGA